MPPKDASAKAPTLKGSAAESAILEYIKKCNRPYGAADISANLKGAVSKPATQKVLLALAEKGQIDQKTYGKQTFFVAKQSELVDLSSEELAALEKELENTNGQIKSLTITTRNLANESTKIRLTPPTAELGPLMSSLETELGIINGKLAVLRGPKGFELPSPEQLEKLDQDWTKWRAEWIKRKKWFREAWGMVTDSLPPAQAHELEEELGIEQDSEEHNSLEASPLCKPQKRAFGQTPGKGKGVSKKKTRG